MDLGSENGFKYLARLAAFVEEAPAEDEANPIEEDNISHSSKHHLTMTSVSNNQKGTTILAKESDTDGISLKQRIELKGINGQQISLKQFPVTLGSSSSLASNLDQHQSSHITVTSCKQLQYKMCLIDSQSEDNQLIIKAIDDKSSLTLNSRKITVKDGPQYLMKHDQILFPCTKCFMPHLFIVVMVFQQASFEESKVMPVNRLFGQIVKRIRQEPINYPQTGFFSRHQNTNISPVGYEDNFAQSEKAQASSDFTSSTGQGDFVDTSTEQGLWSSNIKETLKKYMFLFGFDRLEKIRKVSDTLSRQPLEQVQAYANSFIKVIYENLPKEYENELRKFLAVKINYNLSVHLTISSKHALIGGSPNNPEEAAEQQEDQNVGTDLKFWGGEKILPQIVAWSRRLLLLDVLERIMTQYKRDRQAYLDRPADQQDWRVAQLYRTKDNLINYCTEEQLMGMKPASWWQRSHDVDLLQGTYKYGFANYVCIKEDKKLGWSDVITQDQVEDRNFPSPEHLTKRLKKLLSIALRVDRFDFEKVSIPEKTGLNLQEKTQITKILADVGIDCSKDRPMTILKTKVSEKLQKPCDANERQLEKFVSQLSNEAYRMVREYNQREKKAEEEGATAKSQEEKPNEFKVPKEKELKQLSQHADLKLVKFDPDGDGFNFGIVEAFKVHKRTMFFNFIRKTLLANSAKGFTDGADAFLQAHEELSEKNVCEGWETPKQDLALLMAIGDKGVGYLRQIKYQGDDYGLAGVKMNKKKLLKRAEWVCQAYRTHFTAIKSNYLKLQEAREQEFLTSSAGGPKLGGSEAQKLVKASNLNVRTDEAGNIQYPIQVTGTLKILNLGVIDPSRNMFHSPSNIFPIGFKSVRESASILEIGRRAEYTCEILDDGTKPMFKVTCSDEPNNPIVQDSASGSWLQFVKRTNEIQAVRKSKPSVSGPDRFGLAEPAVLRIIQNMPNAEQCVNFRRKQFVQR